MRMHIKHPGMKRKKSNIVLIAIDSDQTALKVAETGYKLAKSMNALVTLLHVVAEPEVLAASEFSPITGFADYAGILPMQFENNDKRIKSSQHFLEKSKKHLGDDEITTLVEEGDFAGTILTTAEKIHADFIVMGCHSKQWIESIILGSVTAEVLKHTKVPLYIIPAKNK